MLRLIFVLSILNADFLKSGLLVSGTSKNRVVILNHYPEEKISEDVFSIVDSDIDIEKQELNEDDVAVQLIGISVDPYLRGLTKKDKIKNYFAEPFQLNKPITSTTLCKVIKSKNEKYPIGSYVSGFGLPWQNFQVLNPSKSGLTIAPPVNDIDEYYKFLFPFNIAPLSAWLPIRQFWPKESISKEDVTAYVSGAAGAVGSIAGQILKKVYGFKRVIGSAGSDEKVKYLIEKLGYDDAFNYKKESPYDALSRLAPNKIDFFFDNVGGSTLDAALENMAFGGKVISCGSIEGYDTSDSSFKMKNLFQITINALTIQGYLVFQFSDFFEIGNKELLGWSKDGLLITDVTYLDGLENAPKALVGLFKGDNIGKMMVRVVDEQINNKDEL